MVSFAFAAAPQSDDPWWDYQIIMWQPHTPEQNAALKNLGITAGQSSPSASTSPLPAVLPSGSN